MKIVVTIVRRGTAVTLVCRPVTPSLVLLGGCVRSLLRGARRAKLRPVTHTPIQWTDVYCDWCNGGAKAK